MEHDFQTAENFRIKVVEPIKKTTRAQRTEFLKEAQYNAFRLKAENVYVDCITDSGTTAMSTEQWSAMMPGDESYAGAKSFYKLEASAQDFKGDIGLKKVQKILDEHGKDSISVIIITITCNNNGGEPVSMGNIRAVSEFARKHDIPLVIDSARLAENAWFIKHREPGYAGKEELTWPLILTATCP